MIKNLTTTQMLLIALAAVVLLIVAFSFYLLQDPSGPLPFFPGYTTSPSVYPPAELTSLPSPSDTALPPRQTSYTPFATLLTPAITITPGGSASPEVPTTVPPPTGTLSPAATTASPGGTKTVTTSPSRTSSTTLTSTVSSLTPSATITPTLSAGEVAVTGRMLLNGTPVPSVLVEFKDDIAPRQAFTNSSGHYWFTTLAPGTTFSLTFRQKDNPPIAPLVEISSLAWIEGTLPSTGNPIDLPDFEISLNLNALLFEPASPTDGVTYSASVISLANPIQFIWTLYSLGGSYHIELGAIGSDQRLWHTSQLSQVNYWWDGTLDDGTHITQGIYWWRVAVTKNLGNYVVVIFTQPRDITFNP